MKRFQQQTWLAVQQRGGPLIGLFEILAILWRSECLPSMRLIRFSGRKQSFVSWDGWALGADLNDEKGLDPHMSFESLIEEGDRLIVEWRSHRTLRRFIMFITYLGYGLVCTFAVATRMRFLLHCRLLPDDSMLSVSTSIHNQSPRPSRMIRSNLSGDISLSKAGSWAGNSFLKKISYVRCN